MRYHILNNVLGPDPGLCDEPDQHLHHPVRRAVSFLGLGVTPPSAEWGLMLNKLRQAIWVNPLVAALPGVMIFITSMCFNLMSDGLRRPWTCGCERLDGSSTPREHRAARAAAADVET